MASRYQTAKQLKDKYNKRKVSTVIIPPVPESESDIQLDITSTDRLDKIAYRFYQDASFWWIIASTNGIGKGSLIVKENTLLRIPGADTIQDLISNTNKER